MSNSGSTTRSSTNSGKQQQQETDMKELVNGTDLVTVQSPNEEETQSALDTAE